MNAVTEPAPLIAMGVAGPAFSLVRNPVLSFLLNKPAGLWTRALGARLVSAATALPVEILAFGATQRTVQQILHPGSQDWRLGKMAQEAGALGLMLGLFKIHGRAAQLLLPRNLLKWGPVAAGVGMYSGIVHSHLWEERLGWRDSAPWSEVLGQSLVTFLQLRTMGALSHSLMGRRYQAWAAGLEARVEQKLARSENFFSGNLPGHGLVAAGHGLALPVGLPKGSAVDASIEGVYRTQGLKESAPQRELSPDPDQGMEEKSGPQKKPEEEKPLFHDWSWEKLILAVEEQGSPVHAWEIVRRIEREKDGAVQAALQNALNQAIRTYRESLERLGMGDDFVRGNPGFHSTPMELEISEPPSENLMEREKIIRDFSAYFPRDPRLLEEDRLRLSRSILDPVLRKGIKPHEMNAAIWGFDWQSQLTRTLLQLGMNVTAININSSPLLPKEFSHFGDRFRGTDLIGLGQGEIPKFDLQFVIIPHKLLIDHAIQVSLARAGTINVFQTDYWGSSEPYYQYLRGYLDAHRELLREPFPIPPFPVDYSPKYPMVLVMESDPMHMAQQDYRPRIQQRGSYLRF
jgi:hypothetical protein